MQHKEHQAKILLVEDEANIRENVYTLLTMSEFTVKAASSVEEAMIFLENFEPDLILCDVVMPGAHGIQLLLNVKAMPRLSSIPFVFLTAKSEPADIKLGLDLGASDYITKPFKFEALTRCIIRMLGKEVQ